MKTTVEGVERMRCGDEYDYTCTCGERFAYASCSGGAIHRCPHCGRIYEAETDPVHRSGVLPNLYDLPRSRSK